MNKATSRKIHCIAAGSALAVMGAAAYLIAPGKAVPAAKTPFTGRNFAHRGLHRRDKTVPENSIPAFEAAARIGYGIELDVHLTADGQLVVFHDDTTDRVCGVPGRVDDMTLHELARLRLCGTEYGIPTLSEVLRAVGGRSPLIVELKRGRRNRELCRKTYELLRDSGCRYCVESFDPGIVTWFRFHAPEVLRGQLSSPPDDLKSGTSPLSAFLLGHLLTNVAARPQFIAYKIGKKPFTVRLCERMGAMRVAWTSLEWKTEAKNDAVIFQFYRPMVKYK